LSRPVTGLSDEESGWPGGESLKRADKDNGLRLIKRSTSVRAVLFIIFLWNKNS
jgi:hypothetical protein